ncbi:MAG: hypothetical protein CL758_02315 [Chloroflexi bacterium]|nr:hypothetical protein [Chloroflexota bacterium]|tara:strand:+ start:123 stop:395 length:273 start_codon:yes stop_codon:yes gene_type:complete
MSIKVIVSLNIKNFESFSKVFNSEEAKNARKKVGLIAKAHKNLDNPTNAVVLGTVTSKENFLGFISTSEQGERMKSAGVISEPTVIFLED